MRDATNQFKQKTFCALKTPNCWVKSGVEFTNIKCVSLDRKFTEFEYCFIKAVNRTYKYISVKAKMYQIADSNLEVKFQFMKKENGYKPFLYRKTIDGCRFMKTFYDPVAKFFYDLFSPYTNINHTCPFDHDLIIDKMDVVSTNYKFTSLLPFPRVHLLCGKRNRCDKGKPKGSSALQWMTVACNHVEINQHQQ
ncbi:uncharacterized protein LOC119674775 [Teleopsis dalmanni]|uniref:uncharacterized protein LOC119674775 n=1 Tax=Teleopsis dalmanni TaxID=139649 RepID=UPI0018CDB441|nr:uncharacterized protein LOC119674775 [Teleopsis dalmanni]